MFLINIPLSFCCCGENLVYLLRERTRKLCLLSIPPNILIRYDHFNPPGPPCELFKADITAQTRSHSRRLFSDAITPSLLSLSSPRDAPLFPTHWLTFLLIRKHPPGPACCVTSPFSNSRQLSVSDHSSLLCGNRESVQLGAAVWLGLLTSASAERHSTAAARRLQPAPTAH